MQDTNTEIKRKYIFGISLIMLVFFCFFCLAVSVTNSEEEVAFDNEATWPFSDGWTAVFSTGEELAIAMPKQLNVKAGEPYSIMRELPEEMPKPSVLCFRSSHQIVSVSVDNSQLYTFGTDQSLLPFGKSPGSAWNLVRLPDDVAGKKLIIEFTALYDIHAGWIDEIRIGSKAAHLFRILKEYLPDFVVCVVIMICGIVMVLLHLLLVRKHTQRKDILYLGMFSIFVSFWMIGEAKLIQFFIGNQLAAFTSTIICLMIAPIPLIKFVGELKDFRYKQITVWLVRLLYLITVAVLSLQLFNVLDFMDIMPHLSMVLFIITAAGMILVLLDYFVNKNKNLRFVALSLFILGMLALVELTSWTYLGNKAGGSFLRIGVLIFILIQAMIAAKHGVRIFHLSRVASIDALTGCQNRMAFTHRLAELQGNNKVGVVMADLNNLKLINDTFGHEMGDDSIIRFAQRFEDTFSAMGDCYRIGGDEFLFMGTDVSLDVLIEHTAAMTSLCSDEQKSLKYAFNIAVGCAVFDPETDDNIAATIRRADGYMYENKMLQKSRPPTSHQY